MNETTTTAWAAFMQRVQGQCSAAVVDLQTSRTYQLMLAFVALSLMFLMGAQDAQAQTGNPFNDANDELLQYGTYGLVAGGVIMGIIVGVRAGKAIYKTLAS